MSNSHAHYVHVPSLRVGEYVEIRAEREILASLDENGTIDGLPFMPEMLAYCGKRFRVYKRADKTCDTINYSGARRMYDTIHLEGTRCDGKAHGGCHALCLLFWKEAWLKRVDQNSEAGALASSGPANVFDSSGGSQRDSRWLSQFARQQSNSSDEDEIRYRCQATDLLLASSPLAWWDVRQYLRDVLSRNVSVMDVVRAALFRLFCHLLKLRGYRALLWSYNRLQSWRGGTPYPYRKGTLKETPVATLDLKPGELVRIKSQDEILQTVNARNRNRGLSFDAERVRFCGGEYRVLARAERIIDEGTGKIIKLSRDCIILDGVVCTSQYSDNRLFCPRELYTFWREIWLTRVHDAGERAAALGTDMDSGEAFPTSAGNGEHE